MRKWIAVALLLAAGPGTAWASAPLVEAARNGDRATALALLDQRVDVNQAESDGTTALHWAVYNDDVELVTRLIRAGANVNAKNDYGATPMSEAAVAGNPVVIERLLKAGADPDSPNAEGQTALMILARTSNVQAAKLLLRHGADVNAREQWRGQTALMWAAAQKQPAMVKLLVEHGADVNARSKMDTWQRQVTAEPRAQHRPMGGLTPLLFAARAGCLECVKILVEAGAEVDMADPEGISPLLMAITNFNFDIASYLLDKGANPGAWDMYGRTPLYVAVDMNSFRGGGFGGFGGPVRRPPSKATAMDVVKRLLAMGVDPNHQLTRMRPNGNGRGRFTDYMMRGGTGPLMIATLSYDTEAIEVLLANGAEVDLPNVFQITPLMAAAGMTGTSRFSIPQIPDIQDRAIRTMELLLAAGADINARVTDSRTRTARLIAYIQGRDNEGKTALFSAAELGWDKVVKFLLDRGADPTIRDASGKTALDYARAGPPPGPGGARMETPGRDATIALLEAALAKAEAGAPATPAA